MFRQLLEYAVSSKNFEDIYQEIEYISSTGTQYINTDLIPNNNHSYNFKISYSSQSNQNVLGSRSSGAYNTSTDQIYINYNPLNQWPPVWYKKTGLIINIYNSSADYGIGEEVTVDVPQVYNVSISQTGLSITTATRPYYLFCLNNVGSAAAFFSGSIYYFKIYDNNVLVRDFIPCYRKSDGVIGLYDAVEKKFYTNQGTGTFIKGPDI